jgi:hypothetical protein
MDLKVIVDRIKTFLSDEIKLVEAKTTDGIILNYDALEVGAEIFIVDETGTNPAPDSEYTLEDGTIITVKDGKIEAITLPEAPVEGEPETEEPVEEMKADTELITRIEALEKENIEIKDMLMKIAENLGKVNFKQELKEEVKDVEVKLSTSKFLENTKNTDPSLSNIFRNMYK